MIFIAKNGIYQGKFGNVFYIKEGKILVSLGDKVFRFEGMLVGAKRVDCLPQPIINIFDEIYQTVNKIN